MTLWQGRFGGVWMWAALRCGFQGCAHRVVRALLSEVSLGDLQAFISGRRRAAERAIAAIEARGAKVQWRVRLRIRLGSKLNVDHTELRASFLGRRVVVKSRTKGELLKDAKWVVLAASRFKTAESAIEFGEALQSCISIVAARKHIPVDVGADNAATSMTSERVKDAVANEGKFLFDDVHGLDVLPQTPGAHIIFGEATLSTAIAPNQLFDPVNGIGRSISNLSVTAKSAALLINSSHMAEHPVARLALSVAAVELISRKEKWNERQKAWIRRTRDSLEGDLELTDEEKAELYQAAEGMFNFGSLEKTRRLIKRIGREDLIPAWDELYKGRSKLFHGSQYLTNSEIVNMSAKASDLCGKIVNAYVNLQLSECLHP